MTDLLDYIEWPALQALNVKADKGIDNALKQVRERMGWGPGGGGARFFSSLSPSSPATPGERGNECWPEGTQGGGAGNRIRSLLYVTPSPPPHPPPPKGLRDTADLTAESDTDAQLLLNIPFTQAVRVSSIAVAAPPGSAAPRTLRLFVDRPSLGFAEAEADPPAQEVVLTPADVAAGTAVPLRAARFGRVNQLAILVADNQGGDEDEATVVASIRLAGSAGETFDVNAIKKVDEA